MFETPGKTDMDARKFVLQHLIEFDLGREQNRCGARARQSRSAFKRACATAVWPDALQ